MAENTKISWADHTFNPWIGCTKVSDGCDHCYAETLDRRWGHSSWGPGAPRRRTSEAYWRKPLAWQRRAAETGIRERVFCASLADVFDGEAPTDALRHLFALIHETPNLDWLLLTKRPARIVLPTDQRPNDPCLDNIWIGISAEDQETYDARWPVLMDRTRANVPTVRFVSYEPAIGPLDLCSSESACGHLPDWIIIGGESGPGARPMDLTWVVPLIAQCKEKGVACFVKQLGRRPVMGPAAGNEIFDPTPIVLKDQKGGEPDEWPANLRVREFPGCTGA